MKPEEQIDQKQLLKMIKVLNDQFKTKIKTKGSITDLAEAFATGVEALNGRNEPMPEEAIDFYNDLFNDESTGYKDVDVAKTESAPEEEAPLEEAEPEPHLKKRVSKSWMNSNPKPNCPAKKRKNLCLKKKTNSKSWMKSHPHPRKAGADP